MTDMNRNIGNSFEWVLNTYQHAISFLDRLQVLMQRNEPPLAPVCDRLQTKLSYSFEPKNMLTRAIGDFYAEEENKTVLENGLAPYRQMPFIIFRFFDGETMQSNPKLIYGHLTNFDQHVDDISGNWYLLRELANQNPERLSRPDARVERDDISYDVKCDMDDLSNWIGLNEEDQEQQIAQMAEVLSEHYSIG